MLNEMAPVLETAVSNKCLLCLSEQFIKFITKNAIENKSVFGLDNGWAPNRQQAIGWTNVDPILWRHSASPCYTASILVTFGTYQ